MSASLDFLDDYDELEPFQGITYMTTKPRVVVPSLNVSLLTNLCELTTIVERILREIYSESRESNLAQRANISREIKSQLINWRQNLPPRLDYLSFPDQAVLLPQSTCLLYVPFTDQDLLIATDYCPELYSACLSFWSIVL